MQKFSKEVINQLKHYVYIYSDPETDDIFYVGKGVGNRVFSHLTDNEDVEKSRMIKRIRDRGQEPKIEILIHGLEDDHTALKVEASVIDLIGKEKLTNRVRGFQSGVFGRVSVNQLISHYDREHVIIDESVMLIRLTKAFRYDLTDIELYDAVRGVWRIGDNREKVDYAFAVFDGIVHEVYKVEGWFKAGSTFNTRGRLDNDSRWEFVGHIAEDTMRSKYLRKSVEHYLTRGAQNPIKYVNVLNKSV
ncbi:LEM-3-like GIY-YIG domain-containing protein [Virgibacillus sediminis]|uniref:GIY-YIG domain-containing protein n=1 Tax=Virgibacillus sediminis TaxID=202260 RepID=A0ABV7A454_9BACI